MKTKADNKYNFIFRERRMAVFHTDLLLRDYGVFEFVLIGDGSILDGFASDKEIEIAAKIGLDLFSDGKKIERLETLFEKNYAGYNKLLNDSDAIDFKKLDNRQIKEYLHNLYVLTKKNLDIYFLTESHFLAEVEKRIFDFVSAKREKSQVNGYIIDLTASSNIVNFANVEELEWIDLIKDFQKTKIDARKNIKNHYKKFRFMFYDEETDYLQKRFEEMSLWGKDRLDRLKEKISIADKTIERKRNKAIQILNPPGDILTLCESVRKTAILRLNLRFFMKSGYLAKGMLEEIAKRNNLGLNQIRNCLISDVYNILGNKKIDLRAINERSRGFAAVKKKGKWTYYTGKKAEKIAESIRPVINRDATIIKGNTASMGDIRGIVRVIKNVDDKLNEKLQKMVAGEILVTEMTRPQLMSVCKKAGAIITDEGGINCHAAIISRELNVPCITGTKFATQLLNDGDIVEINGDNSSVEIIKKFLS